MAQDSIRFGPVPRPVRILLLFLVPAAMLAGLYARFKGIGTWPLSVDEFYSSRSVDHVLLTGWPRFPCGGYYSRGLVFQYVVAGLRSCGLSPESAGRLVAGICSLAVLPAAYRIGARAGGGPAGWLVVIVLAVSIWEIEMARFDRMYAPFQAVFTWYVVFYLRYTLDRDMAALRWMIGLSVLGVLTWEGGALLGLASLFAVVQSHEHGRLKAVDWRRLAWLSLLLVLLILATRDLREFGEPAAAPAGASGPAISHIPWAAVRTGLRQHLRWICAFLPPLAIAAGSLRWIWSRRREWLAAAGLSVALACAAAHAFTLGAGILALMLLLRLIDWRELTGPDARWFLLALGGFLVFWLAYAQFSHAPLGEAAAQRGALPAAVQYVTGFPAVYEDIVRPWARTLPLLSLELALAIAFLFCRAVAGPSPKDDPIAVLLGLLIVMALAVGATPTLRIETRYTFFWYPLTVILAVSAVAVLARRRPGARYAPLLAAAVPLLCFGATEDFQPRHMIDIDSAKTNFRIGMSEARADHYYLRNDMRGVGDWLAAHVRPGDVVIAGIPNLDQYYHAFDYFYLDGRDARFDAYICRDGRTERWTGHPVIHGDSELRAVVEEGHPVYVTVYADVEQQLRDEAQSQGWQLTRAWTAADEQTHVMLIVAQPAAPSDQAREP